MPEAPTGPVGFVGLGRMGGPMVRRLAAAGHRVHAHDASAAAAAVLADVDGVALEATLDGLAAAEPSTVLLILPSSDVVEAVLLGAGLLDHLAEGAVVVDMSSSEPLRTRALSERAASAGVTLVDAPVSGGVGGAEAGTLTVMVGGPEPVVEAVRPLLSVLGSRVVHAGDVGAGHATKALNNLLSATHLLSTAEAMAAGAAFGLDPATVIDVVNGSSGRSGSTEAKWPTFVLPGTYDSGFGLDLMLKDLRIALGLAEAAGTPASLSARALEAWAAAAEDLAPSADHTEIARWVAAGGRAPRTDPRPEDPT